MQYKTLLKKAKWLLGNAVITNSERSCIKDFLTRPDGMRYAPTENIVYAMVHRSAERTRRGLSL